MAIYKHKETGAVIISDSELAGNWELVTEKATKKKKEVAE